MSSNPVQKIRASASAGAAASARLQIPGAWNTRGGTAAPCCPRPTSCPSSSPCRVPRAPCGDASRAAVSNSIVSVSVPFSALNLYEMVHARNHAADGWRVFHFQHLLHAPESQPANGLAHVARAADEADYPLDLQLPGFLLARCFFRRCRCIRCHGLRAKELL